MFKRRYGRIKKRTFVVLAICLTALVLPIFLLSLVTTKSVESGNIADFSVNEPASRQIVQGLGYNIVKADDGNYLKNNSFEPLSYKQNLIIDSGDDQTLRVVMPNDPQTGIYEDDFFIGAKAQVITTNTEGKSTLKKSGIINQYLSDQIDDFQSIPLPIDIPKDVEWSSIAELNQKIVFGGSDGYILVVDSFSETNLSKLPSEAKVAGICIYEENFLALDESGNFFNSLDGIDWTYIFAADEKFLLQKTKPSSSQNDDSLNENINWLDLASRVDEEGKQIFVAVGEGGYILYGNTDEYYLTRLNSEENINSVVSNSDGFFLVGENSVAFYSETGEKHRYLDIPVKANWQTVSSRGTRIMIAGENGQVVFSNDGHEFRSLSHESITDISVQYTEHDKLENQETIVINPDFVSCSILSNKQLIMLDSRGLIYFSGNLGESWNALGDPEDAKYNVIRRLPSGRLIVTGYDGEIEYATMGLVIELDTKLEQGEFEKGDSLVIEQLASKPITKPPIGQSTRLAGEWFVSDPESALIQFSQISPGGGKSSLKINLEDSENSDDKLTGLYSEQEIVQAIFEDADFVIQQEIDETSRSNIQKNSIFNFEFWAMTTANNPVDLTLNFSGLSTAIEPMNKRISGNWQKYQGVFVIPKNAIREDKPLWLQLELKGSGNLYLDNIWFGPADNSKKNIDTAQSEGLPNNSIVRLAFVPIGTDGYPSESWLSSHNSYSFYHQDQTDLEILSQTNLVTGLELCHSFNADPWLLIDSQAIDSELRHLMQYLFGPQSTYYGNLRNEHGALSRYSDTFNQIYFEITDDNDLFDNDWQRSSYVNWVIKVLSETPEYLQVKNNIIFIDGMKYKDNIIMSEADYHASELNLDQKINNSDELNEMVNKYSELMPRDPDRAMSVRSELIRNLKVNPSQIRLADLVSVSLNIMGDEVKAVLLDYDLIADSSVNSFADCYGQIGEVISGLNPYLLSSNIEQKNTVAFAFGKDNQRVIIIANLSDSSASCQVLNIELTGFEQSLYDDQGKLLEQSEISKNKTVFSILPGGVIVLKGTLD